MSKRKRTKSHECLNLYEGLAKKYLAKSKCKQFLPGIMEHEFRLGIVGGSGSGKTNLLMNILNWTGLFDVQCMWKHVVYVCPTRQPLVLAAVDAQPKRIFVCESLDDLPEVDKFEAEGPNLVIFDDLMSENKSNQLKIERWFLKSRIKDCSCVYIAQSYFDIPKVVRRQFTHLILKRINSLRNIDNILREHNDSSDPLFIRKCYKKCMEKKTGFFFINLEAPEGRFRNGLHEVFDVPNQLTTEKTSPNSKPVSSSNSHVPVDSSYSEFLSVMRRSH